MSETFGPDFITVTDEDGNDFELEHLDTLEYNNEVYMAFFPAVSEDAQEGEPADIDLDDEEYGLIIMKVVEEDGEEQDERFEDGVEAILEVGQASVSMLQRRLKLGYARAARLMDQIEAKGIVGPSEGAKPRQILITKDQWRQMQSGQPLGEEPLPAEDPLPPVEEEILTFDPVPQDFLE